MEILVKFLERKNAIPIQSKIQDSDFSQKYDFFQFFNRSLVKTRRTAERPTVLKSLLPMLTIPITLRKIYFFTHFRIFCIVFFLRKM